VRHCYVQCFWWLPALPSVLLQKHPDVTLIFECANNFFPILRERWVGGGPASLCSSSKTLQLYTLLSGGCSSSGNILHFTTRPVPVPCANLSHHRVQKFAIATTTYVGPKKQICDNITHHATWKYSTNLHIPTSPFFDVFLAPKKTCSIVGLIKLFHLLTGIFWDDVDNFLGLFEGFYYIFNGESTSKADIFDNFCSTKIFNTLVTQKSPGIRSKRPVTKRCIFGGAWRMSVFTVTKFLRRSCECVPYIVLLPLIFVQSQSKW